ncbi:hypothetical protein PM082_012378 [Marasmius tenuissimus]|nr:hypothetical protein PM082_012378 [Marasmius tenuissimus]
MALSQAMDALQAQRQHLCCAVVGSLADLTLGATTRKFWEKCRIDVKTYVGRIYRDSRGPCKRYLNQRFIDLTSTVVLS